MVSRSDCRHGCRTHARRGLKPHISLRSPRFNLFGGLGINSPIFPDKFNGSSYNQLIRWLFCYLSKCAFFGFVRAAFPQLGKDPALPIAERLKCRKIALAPATRWRAETAPSWHWWDSLGGSTEDRGLCESIRAPLRTAPSPRSRAQIPHWRQMPESGEAAPLE